MRGLNTRNLFLEYSKFVEAKFWTIRRGDGGATCKRRKKLTKKLSALIDDAGQGKNKTK
jgi:hypothetical protein